MIYAPIVIPTLNRYDHLVQCLESLKKNKYASETEVYISVDFPPADKYKDGCEKIKKYLPTVDGFKKVNYYFQENNMGPEGNSWFLIDIVAQKYDRYIFTEDDNIFSEDFLYFINSNLEKYKDNSDIFTIGGYFWPISMNDITGDGLFVIKINSILSAWGYGVWIDKYDSLCSRMSFAYFDNALRNISKVRKLRKINPFIYSEFIKNYLEYSGCMIADGEIQQIDLSIGTMMYLDDKYMLYPSMSLVQNQGNDGSGTNCVNLDQMANDNININECQECDVNNRNFNYSNQKIVNHIDENDLDINVDAMEINNDAKFISKISNFLVVPKKELIKTDVAYIMFLIFGRKITKRLLEIVK